VTPFEFLADIANWSNHRALLWPALEATSGDVVEMGLGGGSTPFLHAYCASRGRKLWSYDNNPEWVTKFVEYQTEDHKLICVSNWDAVSEAHPDPAVVLVDHAPGERRYVDIERFAQRAEIIVVHDSEPAATGYMLKRIWPLFKYRLDLKSPGAWATAISNKRDLSVFDMQSIMPLVAHIGAHL
jgi:hypothetical protein